MTERGEQIVLSRPFRAGSLRFFVGSTERHLVDLAEELFQDLPSPADLDGKLLCWVLTPVPEAGRRPLYALSGPVVGDTMGMPLPVAITTLVSALSRATLDDEPERLHIHAAGAVRHGRAALFAAQRETGKTTTVARLVLDGWGIISDEAISVGRCDSEVAGFPKPLSVKPGGRTLLPELADHFLPTDGVAADSVLHVSLGAVGAQTAESAVPHLVALLRRDPATTGAQPRSRVIHPVDAVVGLMGETLDAGRFGDDAVLELSRLAARSHCYEILVGDPALTVAEVTRLFDQPAVNPLPVTTLPGSLRIPPAIRSVRVGDRVVIHEQPEGSVLALDAAATQIWLNVGGWPAEEELDLAGPVVAPFVEQLVALGLVERDRIH